MQFPQRFKNSSNRLTLHISNDILYEVNRMLMLHAGGIYLMDEKGSKSSKVMKLAIVLFAIGFEAISFELFMRLVYMNEKYMARWHMWVWFVVGVVFLVPSLYFFYKANKMKEAERNAYYEEFFKEEEKNISVEG